MTKSKLTEKILSRNNPNKTGGHDPDVARNLLKAGRLPDRGARCAFATSRLTVNLETPLPRYAGVPEARNNSEAVHRPRNFPKGFTDIDYPTYLSSEITCRHI